MNPAISVRQVSKKYRLGASPGGQYRTLRESVMGLLTKPLRATGGGGETLWALKDVSFDVRPGEAVGLIGRNGAGKSTLLKVISRITAPTGGGVEFRGRVGSLLEVGTGFHPELTGRENVFLNGAILGMPRKEIVRKFDRIVEFAEVGKFVDTPVKRYSSGMYVRLAFSVAAHMEPDVLLIDEVLSVGDLAFQRKCMDHAKRMLERNVTLLFVSHNMFAIKAMCDRAIYLSQGAVGMDGPVEDVARLYDQDNRLDVPPWAAAMVGKDPEKCDIFVRHVEITDESGRPTTLFDHGRRMKVRIHYEVNKPIERPNFNVSFIRSDDVVACNYNTAMDAVETGTVSGSGVVELTTPPLKLVAELYGLQVLVWDAGFQRLYCAQMGPNFHVRHDTLNTEFGVFHEAAQWTTGRCPEAG